MFIRLCIIVYFFKRIQMSKLFMIINQFLVSSEVNIDFKLFDKSNTFFLAKKRILYMKNVFNILNKNTDV